jgi:hypothetical protein
MGPYRLTGSNQGKQAKKHGSSVVPEVSASDNALLPEFDGIDRDL